VLASAVGLVGWLTWSHAAPLDWPLLLLLLTLATLAQHFPLQLAPHYKVSVALAVYFVAVLRLAPPVAIALTGGAQLLGGLTLRLRRDPASGRRRRGLTAVVFNAAQLALAVGLACLPLAWWPQPWAALPAAAVLHVANSGSVALMIALRSGRHPLAIWRTGRREAILEATALLLLGLAGASLAMQSPWALLPLAPPTALLHVALSRMARERAAAEARLAHRAAHDPLTGLPNRAHFHDRLARELARREGAAAVLFVDLDGFKAVNDTFGHEAGDRLLVAVAQRLRGCVRPADIVARLGGDEFTVLLGGVGDAGEAVTVARRILDTLATRPGVSARITASVGVAVGAVGTAPDELLRRADAALYDAKAAGKGRYALFDDAQDASRAALLRELRGALEHDELALEYQPKVAPATGQVAGFEARVRWHHPGLGPLSSAMLPPLIEEAGLGVALGRWALTTACRQLAAWQRCYRRDVPLLMCISLDAAQLRDPDLPTAVAHALREAGTTPAGLVLEIPEHLLRTEVQIVRVVLPILRGLGVLVAISGVGVGDVALGDLPRLPFDALKLDRAVVAGLDAGGGTGAGDVAVARAAVGVAHALGARAMAEGVERAGQMASLRRLGYDLTQGLHLGPPLSAVAAKELLDRDGPLVPPVPE